MLKLEKITKEYAIGDTKVGALRGVDMEFRENEFVAVLGPSGCGKTTLLNIIGGLDQYTSGDLIINGKSTKKFTDSNWDNYRNHSVGFVFQSYNLIPHQSVLANVELALTLTGVSKSERREKARTVLEKVGLGDQLGKRPNQMSGGQMQRVAIARALINDPDILLADEPTGALDSETSLQIMDLLKEIARDKLVVMVTHNPELAENYANRTIQLLDGLVTADSNPFVTAVPETEDNTLRRRPSMSFLTALSLSLNNLMTKKTRTLLTAFAGSIGIIGIALILALSNGVNAYIQKTEEDTLSSYPISIEESTMDLNSMITSFMGNNKASDERDDSKVYSNNIMTDMMSTMINGMTTNNLEAFKKFIEKESDIPKLTTDVKYTYSTTMNIFTDTGYRVNPDGVMKALGMEETRQARESGGLNMNMGMGMGNVKVWNEMIADEKLIDQQYEVLKGGLPKSYNEIVVIVDENNEISDYVLYALGVKDSTELSEMMKKATAGEKIEDPEITAYSYDDLMNLKFRLLLNTDFYQKNAGGTWTDKTADELYLLSKIETAVEVKVVGVLRANSDSALSGAVGYRSDLMTYLIDEVNDSEIVKQQKANPDTDVLTGFPFATDEPKTMEHLNGYISMLPAEEQAQYAGFIEGMRQQGMTDEQIVARFEESMSANENKATYDGNMALLGVSDLEKPAGIQIYPKDFEAKEKISKIINDYNTGKNEADKITYTDLIGLMMSSVTIIINAISYILIAFVSISLIVSSIMIGIITYISVLERTKEIGILRALGASKRDISRVFNAETLIVGFVSGTLGILISLLLLIPINIIIQYITEIGGLAILPLAGGGILVLISMLLTFVAGLIPSRIAAKKDPVIALRTE